MLKNIAIKKGNKQQILSLSVSLLIIFTLLGQAKSQAPPRKPCLDFYGSGRTSFATLTHLQTSGNLIWRLRNNGGVGEDVIAWGFPAQVVSGAVRYPDMPSPGYYDNDNRADVGVYRVEENTYYIRPSTAPNTIYGLKWGQQNDNSNSGDYDGDGRTDPTVIRTTNTNNLNWLYLRSSNNTLGSIVFGMVTPNGIPDDDQPMPGADYNGDGRDDIAVLRLNPNEGETYYVADSISGALILAQQWGEYNTDSHITGDFIGDRRADFAVWRGNVQGVTNGTFWVKENGGNQVVVRQFGIPASQTNRDRAVCGDYNGDGKDDLAVYRQSTSTFYWLNSPDFNSFSGQQFGQPNDIPLAIFFIR